MDINEKDTRCFVSRLGQPKDLSLATINYLIDLCRYSEENIPNVCQLAEMLKAIGEKHGATAAQVTLAWLLAQGEDIIPLPGTRRIKVFSLHFVCPLNDNQSKST